MMGVGRNAWGPSTPGLGTDVVRVRGVERPWLQRDARGRPWRLSLVSVRRPDVAGERVELTARGAALAARGAVDHDRSRRGTRASARDATLTAVRIDWPRIRSMSTHMGLSVVVGNPKPRSRTRLVAEAVA